MGLRACRVLRGGAAGFPLRSVRLMSGATTQAPPSPPSAQPPPPTRLANADPNAKGLVVEFMHSGKARLGVVVARGEGRARVRELGGKAVVITNDQIIHVWQGKAMCGNTLDGLALQAVDMLRFHHPVDTHAVWGAMASAYKRLKIDSSKLSALVFPSFPPSLVAQCAAALVLIGNPMYFKRGAAGQGYRPRAHHAVHTLTIAQLKFQMMQPNNLPRPPLPLDSPGAAIVRALQLFVSLTPKSSKLDKGTFKLARKVLQSFGVDETPRGAETLLRQLAFDHTLSDPPFLPSHAPIHAFVPDKEFATVPVFRMPALAIDSPHTDSPEDALSIALREDGGCSLTMHVVDASSRIGPNCPLFSSACARVAALYTPSHRLTLFPASVHQLLSFNPGGLNLVLSFTLEINSHGDVVDFRISRHRLERVHTIAFAAADQLMAGAKGPWGAELQRLSSLLLPANAAHHAPSSKSTRMVVNRHGEPMAFSPAPTPSTTLLATCSRLLSKHTLAWGRERGVGLVHQDSPERFSVTSPLRAAVCLIAQTQIVAHITGNESPLKSSWVKGWERVSVETLEKGRVWRAQQARLWQLYALDKHLQSLDIAHQVPSWTTLRGTVEGKETDLKLLVRLDCLPHFVLGVSGELPPTSAWVKGRRVDVVVRSLDYARQLVLATVVELGDTEGVDLEAS